VSDMRCRGRKDSPLLFDEDKVFGALPDSERAVLSDTHGVGAVWRDGERPDRGEVVREVEDLLEPEGGVRAREERERKDRSASQYLTAPSLPQLKK
jgi:hypothetical protein